MKNRNLYFVTLAVVMLSGFIIWMTRSVPTSRTPDTKPAGSSLSAVPAAKADSSSSPVAIEPAQVRVGGGFNSKSVLERNAVLAEIRKKDVGAIFQEMLDAGKIENDPMKQSAIATTLSYAMREQKPDFSVLERMRQFVEDGSNSRHDRAQVLGIIGFAATPESAELLLAEASTLTDKELKDIAVLQIKQLGEQGRNEELSPILDHEWRVASDQQLIIFTGVSMARIGAPSSIELLLSSALSPDGVDDVRKQAALGALKVVYRKNALPPLASLLSSAPIGSEANLLAFNTLRQISDASSSQTILSWLQAADSRAVSLARDWIAHANASAQLKAAAAALNPAVPFASEQNREAIRAGLAEYNRTHVSAPAGVPLQ